MMVEKERHQKLDMVDHVMTTARKQRKMNAGSQLRFPLLFSPRAQPIEWWVSPTLIS